jgi:protein CMS1
VEEQEQALGSTVLCIGAGTPNRVSKLADNGALKLDRLKLVLLDVDMDAKQRTILDIPEVRADWWILFNAHLRGRVTAGKTRIALFKNDL